MNMLSLLIILAMVSGNDDPKKPASDAGVKRTVLPELAVGHYDRTSGLESSSRISITKKDDAYEYAYKLSTDDGGFIEAEGPVQFVGDRIDLVVKKLEQNRDFTTDGKRFAEIHVMPFFLVKWDRATYLVGEKEIEKFCNDVNLRVESPRDVSGNFFSREEAKGKDDNGAVSTIPDVPTHAKRFILGKPISGKVLSIEGSRAKVDLGEREQVWKNMVLYCEPDEPEKNEMLKKGGEKGEDEVKYHRVMLKVVEVHKDHCVAMTCEHPQNHDIKKIRNGYKVYSRFPNSASREGMYHYRW
jgi:hypothetical protein